MKHLHLILWIIPGVVLIHSAGWYVVPVLLVTLVITGMLWYRSANCKQATDCEVLTPTDEFDWINRKIDTLPANKQLKVLSKLERVLKTLPIFTITLLLWSCSGVTVGYMTVSVNDSTYRQANLFTFHKGYITQFDGETIRNFDVLWYGDSIRCENYSSNPCLTYKIRTTDGCLVLTRQDLTIKYCN